jgi:hypothetical protein
MRRIPWFVMIVVGIVLAAGAGIVRWSVAPSMTVLPGDTNTSRTYTGVAATLANPAWLAGNRTVPALLHNIPVTVVHSDKVLQTNGDNALVSDRRLLTVPGFTLADLTNRYAVDRKNLGPGSASGFTGVTDQRGLTFNWPIGTNKHDYTGWVSDTGRTVTLRYAGEATRGGVDTYVFKADVPVTRITDPQLLKLLPQSMPKSELLTMVPSLGLSTSELTAMSKVLSAPPDPVPFAYTYQATNTYWVAPTSGVVVDISYREVRSVAFATGPALVPVAPVMDLTYTGTPLTLAAAATDARDNADGIQMIETTVPLGLLVGGFVLILVGGSVLAIRRRRPPTFPPTQPTQPTQPVPPRELTRTG